jgi:hypothetical protein
MIGDFGYPDQANVVSPSALRGLVTNLAQANIKTLLRAYEGQITFCRSVRVTNEGRGTQVSLTQVEGVLGGRAFVEPELMLEVAPNQAAVFLVLDETPQSLDPQRPGSLQVNMARARLTTTPERRAALQAVKLSWFPNPGAPERLEAVEDPLWWPATAHVAAHPRSLEAVQRVEELLGERALPLGALFSAARRGRVGWAMLIPELLRYCEAQWRDHPRQIERLWAVARAMEEADQVATLVGMLNDTSGLPKVLTRGGQRLYLVYRLEPLESHTTLSEGRATLKSTFPAVLRDGELVVKASGSPAHFYRISARLESNGIRREFVRSGGAIEPLVQLAAGQAVAVCVEGPGPRPPELIAGLYAPTPTA